MAQKYIYYRHFYIGEFGIQYVSEWTDQDWYDYLHSNHRDYDDMGDESPLKRLHTDIREFEGYV